MVLQQLQGLSPLHGFAHCAAGRGEAQQGAPQPGHGHLGLKQRVATWRKHVDLPWKPVKRYGKRGRNGCFLWEDMEIYGNIWIYHGFTMDLPWIYHGNTWCVHHEEKCLQLGKHGNHHGNHHGFTTIKEVNNMD